MNPIVSKTQGPGDGTAANYNNIQRVAGTMAHFVCPDSPQRHFIIGPSHADEVATTAAAPLLARLPIDAGIAALCDSGKVEQRHVPEVQDLHMRLPRSFPLTRQGIHD